jgi:hypothetical protein
MLEEKGSKLILRNAGRKAVRKVQVDGCAVTEGPRCDYLLIPDPGSEYFVELKGSDVAHAICQLEASIRALGLKVGLLHRHSFIVSHRCPAHSPQIQIWQARFKKHFASSLQIKGPVLEIDI